MKRSEHLCIVDGNVKCAAALETSMEVPQKIKNRIIIWSSNSTSEYIPKRIKSWVLKRYLYNHVHSHTIHNSQKVEVTKCPSTDEWKKKNKAKINKTNSWFFQKINKINHLPDSSRKRGRGLKSIKVEIKKEKLLLTPQKYKGS